jgi:hypothetical protein
MVMISSLPLDLMRNICFYLTSANVANYTTTTTHNQLQGDRILWQKLYMDHFPSHSILSLKVDLNKQHKLYNLASYRKRLMAKRRELSIVSGTYHLKGHTQDSGNGNITPVTANITVNGFFFHGNVIIGKGTIHNNNCRGFWRNGYFGAEKGAWKMSFEEILPTNKGYFIYNGTLDFTGNVITGTFGWSMFPKRNRGTFHFHVFKKLQHDDK